MAKINTKKIKEAKYKEGFKDALVYLKSAIKEITDESDEEIEAYIFRNKFTSLIDVTMSVLNIEEYE